jgi:predicted RNA-binding Zn-ribbon protein involved in translation (DUF1610 family)
MGCEGKIKHLDETSARAACEAWKDTVKRKRWGKSYKRLNAYKCRECGFWHVGRWADPKKKKAANA